MPGTEKKGLTFKISSALKDIIGRDLITDDNIAVFELVKNSYDAHSNKVEIHFINIYGANPTIIIKDNGKGMTYRELKNKWLFVAYSAKKEGTEDQDYRNKIYQNKPYAGAKGIGRFSCDRLGRSLRLESIKNATNSKKEILSIDWTLFEQNIKDEFINIEVQHSSRKKRPNEHHGTTLIITELRENWDRLKLLSLKKSLAKLVNPSANITSTSFKLLINCPEELENDRNENEDEKINGEVKNFIFEELELKTTKVEASIPKNGKTIETTLFDGGTLIYRIRQKNNFNLLNDIHIVIYYLNRAAKLTFAKKMGLASRLYGHIFLYKNGFRIYPFGEPYEDPLRIDIRKSRKKYSTLGTGELMGHIAIYGDNPDLKETSSRGNGLIKTPTYTQLEDFFWIILGRLERYVVDVQKWGLSIEDNLTKQEEQKLKQDILALLSNITDLSGLIDIEYGESFLNNITHDQEDSVSSVIRNLQRVASQSGNQKILKYANNVEKKFIEIKTALDETKKELEEVEEDAKKSRIELEEQISENLFLRSIKSQDFEEIVSFLHHIGISSGNIDVLLKGIYAKLNRGQKISASELRNVIEDVSFENTKILSISKFATKANFKLFTDEAEIDIISYIREYLNNVIRGVNKAIAIKFINSSGRKEFIKKIRPIEINILIDNLVSNSIKAGANNILVAVEESEPTEFIMKFTDDGEGIVLENQSKIFDLGFTTTSGSGLGLFHIKKIMSSMNGDIKLNKGKSKGAEFIIEIKK